MQSLEEKIMRTNFRLAHSESPEEIILRVQKGESNLRDDLINHYWDYIAAAVSRMTKKPARNTDEFSIALEAFNEAIDSFDDSKNVEFIKFAAVVINRRVIDHIRKTKKFNVEYPFTYFEAEDNESFLERYSNESPDSFTNNLEIQEEIMKFKNDLLSYGITYEDLVKKAPKHSDTKLLCINIAKKLASSNELSKKLYVEKRLPVSELTTNFGLSRKTVENHRKYIIALFLILNSDLEVIKSYMTTLTKGV